MRFIRRCVLVFLILSLAASAFGTYIAHPWEQYAWKEANPLLEQVSGTWVCNGPYEMERTLDSLHLENMSPYELGPDEAGLLASAVDARANATVLAQECLDEIKYAQKTALAKEMDTAAQNILPYALATGLLGPLGVAGSVGHVIISVLGNDQRHAMAYIGYCGGYESAWETTMSDSVDALASSMDRVEENQSAARAAYETASFAGLCDADYTGAGHVACLEARAGFDFIDSGSTEGTYGQYNAVNAGLERIRENASQSVPGMAGYAGTMNLIWKNRGALDVLDGLHANAAKAKYDAEDSYNQARDDAVGKRDAANAALAEFEQEKYQLIAGAETISNEIGGAPSGTVAERFAEKKKDRAGADALYGAATADKADASRQGYLKGAVGNMAAADTSYGSLQASLPLLEASADNVVSAKQAEAGDAIAGTESLVGSVPATASVRNKLAEAGYYFSAGQNATLSGDKYRNFAASAAAAREAKTLQTTKSLNESVSLQALKLELRQMIAAAKTDGIPTVFQEELLGQIQDADYGWATDEVRKAEDGLAAAAELQYGYLGQERPGLLERIGLVGGDADDLRVDMANAERGFVDANGNVDYRKGLGRLKSLANTYSKMEKELDGYATQIAGKSISVDSEVFIDSVPLDRPSKITVDMLVVNANGYGAQNVPVDVKLPMPVQLMYSGIVEGADLVGSVAMTGADRARVFLKKVEPYGKCMISFEESETLAHTTKSSKKALGLGDGSASVDDETDFTLDADVDSLTLPAGAENVKIDGIAPGGQLKKGSHALTSSYIAQDAYEESTVNLKSSPLGLNSQVDYDVVIMPKMDLDSVVVYVEPGTNFSGLDVFTLSGESIGNQKKIADWRYSYEVRGLKQGKEASIRVSYILENASGYVAGELAALDGANYSATVKGELEGARAALDAGDANAALAKIKQAEADMKKEDIEKENAEKQAGELRSEIKAGLDEINATLADADGSNSSFVARLSARAVELTRRLADSEGKTGQDALKELEAVDLKWKDNEVKAFRKSSFDSYNELRLRFAAAGNTTTPEEFLAVEADLNNLDTSGRLCYALALAKDLEKAETAVAGQEASALAARAGLRSGFESLRDSVRSGIKAYAAEASAAKGTEYSAMFVFTGKDVESAITELDKLMASGEPELIQNKIDALDQTAQSIAGTMRLLSAQAGNRISLVENTYNETENSMGQQDRDAIEQQIQSMKKSAAAGQYIGSLVLGNKILGSIDAAKKTNNNSLLLLGVTAVAVLAVLCLYIVKQQEAGKPGGGKILKKLDKMEGNEPKEEITDITA